MANTYWRKQTADKALFPDIIWSRPETKAGAGKLAIIGGHGHGFGAPGIAWNTALESDIGVVKVLLPDAIKKTVKYVLPDADYAPSNPSGSFSKKALDEMLQIASWSDAVLLSGDFGRNSETAVLLENFVGKYIGILNATQDAADYFKETPGLIMDRSDTAVYVSLAQLQRMFIATPSLIPITYSMSTPQLAEALHEFTKKHEALLITKHNDLFFIAYKGQIITQPDDQKVWRIKTAARASVFWLQNPDKHLESITSSLLAPVSS